MPMLAVAARRAARDGAAPRARPWSCASAFGVVIAASAFALVFDVDQKLQTWFPNYTHALQDIERSSAAGKRAREATGPRKSTFTAQPNAAAADLKDYGPAPDFTGITAWLNSRPLTVSQLRGKVVLVDFWTYSCINCLRTLPHLEAWDARTARTAS